MLSVNQTYTCRNLELTCLTYDLIFQFEISQQNYHILYFFIPLR